VITTRYIENQSDVDATWTHSHEYRMIIILSFVIFLELQIYATFNAVYCERRGKDYARALLESAAFSGRMRIILGEANVGTFFTQENIEIDSWHVTSRWWKSHLLGRLPRKFNQTDVNNLCMKRRDSCRFFNRKDWESLPSVKPASWKTCAVVGYGSNLLEIPQGSTIDEFDTVIRLGMVNLNKYAVEAGLKNTFVYIRDRKLRKSRNDFIDEDKNGFRASQLHETQRPKAIIYSSFRVNPTAGWPTLTFGGDLTLRLERALKQIMKDIAGSSSPPDPSSGLILPMVLLFSGHCTKIGIFGISSTMGPRYWESVKPYERKSRHQVTHSRRERHLSANHNTKLEGLIWKKIEEFGPSFLNVDVKFYD